MGQLIGWPRPAGYYYSYGRWYSSFQGRWPSGLSSVNVFVPSSKPPVTHGSELIQRSEFYSALNRFDVDGVGPTLRSGRVEKPVHHFRWTADRFPYSFYGEVCRSFEETSPNFGDYSLRHRPTSGQAQYSLRAWGNSTGVYNYECWQFAANGASHSVISQQGSTTFTCWYYLPTNPDGYELVSYSRVTYSPSTDQWHGEYGFTDLPVGRWTSRPQRFQSDEVWSHAPLMVSNHGLKGHETDIAQWYASAYLQAGQVAGSYDVNNLENLLSAKETAGLLSPNSWVPRGGASVLSWIANTYLAYTYGVRPTVSDLRSSLQLIADASVGVYLPSRIVRYSSASFGDITCHLKICLSNPHGAQELTGVGERAIKASLALSPKNLWDLVPYSFVVDWVVPIGDALQRMSRFDDTSRRWDFEYAILSRKRTLSEYTSGGVVNSTTYDRHILDAPPSRLACMAAARGSGINIPAATSLAINLFRL